MKEFLKRVIAFSLIIIIITFILECLLLTRMNLYSYKSNYVKTHADDIECLLLGNSHIEEALIPDSMGTGVFNMAISGRSLVYDVALAEMHVPTMHNLKVLVVPCDYTMFYLGRSSKKMTADQKALSSTIKCMNYKYMDLRVDGFWYWSEVLNSSERLTSKLTTDLIECDSLGFIPLNLSNRSSNWEQKDLPDSKVDITKKKDSKLYEKLNNEFCSLAELTKSHHIRLVLLSTPLYKTYHELMNKTLIGEMNSFIHQLQAKYPHIEYYNYIFDNRFIDDDFNDAGHLSDIGAAKFSKIVKEEILEKKSKTVF